MSARQTPITPEQFRSALVEERTFPVPFDMIAETVTQNGVDWIDVRVTGIHVQVFRQRHTDDYLARAQLLGIDGPLLAWHVASNGEEDIFIDMATGTDPDALLAGALGTTFFVAADEYDQENAHA